MEKTRKVIAFVGALLASAAVSLAIVYFDQDLRSNPTFLFKLMVGLGIAALLCGLFWLSSNEKTSLSTPITANATAMGNVVNVFPQPPPPTPAIEATKPRVPVVLRFSQPANCNLYFENRIWSWSRVQTPDTRTAITLCVSNPLADVGNEPNPKAYAVGAHLTFRGAFSPDGIVERAYWIDEEANNVNIEPGTRKHILLGTFADGVWTIYDNPHSKQRGKPGMQTLRSGGYFDMNPPCDRGVVPTAHRLSVEVRLFSVESGHPLRQESFTINRLDSGIFAAPIFEG